MIVSLLGLLIRSGGGGPSGTRSSRALGEIRPAPLLTMPNHGTWASYDGVLALSGGSWPMPKSAPSCPGSHVESYAGARSRQRTRISLVCVRRSR